MPLLPSSPHPPFSHLFPFFWGLVKTGTNLPGSVFRAQARSTGPDRSGRLGSHIIPFPGADVCPTIVEGPSARWPCPIPKVWRPDCGFRVWSSVDWVTPPHLGRQLGFRWTVILSCWYGRLGRGCFVMGRPAGRSMAYWRHDHCVLLSGWHPSPCSAWSGRPCREPVGPQRSLRMHPQWAAWFQDPRTPHVRRGATRLGTEDLPLGVRAGCIVACLDPEGSSGVFPCTEECASES